MRNLCSLLASCVSIHGTEGFYYRSGRHIKYIREADDLADDIPLIVQTDYYHGNNNTGPFFCSCPRATCACLSGTQSLIITSIRPKR